MCQEFQSRFCRFAENSDEIDVFVRGGTDGTDADPYQQGTYGGYLYINVTDTRAAAGATDTWYKTQLTLVS